MSFLLQTPRYVLVGILVIVVAIGCAGGTRGSGTGVPVGGRLANFDGSPVANALVTVTSQTTGEQAQTTTDSGGNFEVELEDTGESITIVFAGEGFVDNEVETIATPNAGAVDTSFIVDPVNGEVSLSEPPKVEERTEEEQQTNDPASPPAAGDGTGDTIASPTPPPGSGNEEDDMDQPAPSPSSSRRPRQSKSPSPTPSPEGGGGAGNGTGENPPEPSPSPKKGGGGSGGAGNGTGDGR